MCAKNAPTGFSDCRSCGAGEVPVGAVVFDSGGEVVAEAGNSVLGGCDVSAHAEILALRAAVPGHTADE